MQPGDSQAAPWRDRRGTAVGHLDAHGVELFHLGRYVAAGVLVAACLMLSAWSRIDLRGTAVSLDQAERSWKSARAEQARLELELAALKSPATLRAHAESLELTTDIDVVHLPEPQSH